MPRTRTQLDTELWRLSQVVPEPRYGRHRRIHPDRLRLRSFKTECKVALKALTRTDQPKPFVVYGRPRSGTTLFVDLLNQVPGIRCDGELLHDKVVHPTGYLRVLPKRAGPDVDAYGIKLLSYQLVEVQRIRQPLSFFQKLLEMDYLVIHQVRDTWDQSLSLIKALETGHYFGQTNGATRSLEIDPNTFVDRLRWNEAMLEYERELLSHVPHITVEYETDLRSPQQHQPVIDRVVDALGLETHPVDAALNRKSKPSRPLQISNMEAIVAKARAEGLGHLVPNN